MLDSWVEKNLLEESLRFEKICQKGFEFNGKGLVFPTGHIKLTDNSLGKKKVYEALLLKICVGKSYCLPAKSDYKENYKLPYGFDSIYFYNEDEESSQGQGIFRHNYMIFDNSQVLPMYIVHFSFD